MTILTWTIIQVSSICILLYVFLCVQVHACADQRLYVCGCQSSTSGVPQKPSTVSLFLFVDTGSLADLELSNQARLASW